MPDPGGLYHLLFFLPPYFNPVAYTAEPDPVSSVSLLIDVTTRLFTQGMLGCSSKQHFRKRRTTGAVLGNSFNEIDSHITPLLK